jgi:exopolysaccharide biosynthesis polyprenyl glycosylphosphotransferase
MTLRLLLMLSDGLSAAVVFLVVSAARFSDFDPAAVWSVGIDIGPAAFIFALLWCGVLWAMGLYHLRARWSLFAAARDVARANLVVAAITLAALFVFHQDNVSRIFLLVLFLVQPLTAIALRALVRSWFDRLRVRGRNLTYMLVVGTGSLAQRFADEVENHASLGVRVIGHVTVPIPHRRAADSGLADSTPSPEVVVTRPIFGSVEDITDLFCTRVIDEVAACMPSASAHYLEPLIAISASHGKTVRVPRGPEEGSLSGALEEDFGPFLVRSVIHDGHRDLERALKRVLDVVGALVAVVVLSPLIVGTAMAIRLRDGSPILYRQLRVGRHGRPFTIYKFRTMQVDADDRYGEVATLSDTHGPAFKMVNDPRVTPLGQSLRKWAFDELPQLINVLKGDMSLVGPRPAPPREVDQYDLWHRRRLSVRPGMTGLWQVEARFDHHFDDRALLDLRYIDHWSLLMDVGILLRTVPAVLSPRGR